MTTPIYKRLVEITRDGPVESWLSRIADVVERAGLDPADVPWSCSPKTAAFEAQELARRHDKTKDLEDAIYRAEARQSLMDGKGLPPR